MIEKLEKHSEIYLALNDPYDELWDREQSRQVRLLEIFDVKQSQVFLIAAYFHLKKSEYSKLLSHTVILSFRYNVICKLHTGEQEYHYNKLAMEISDHQIGLKKIKEVLLDIYPDDETFYQSFSTKTLTTTFSRNKKIVKYVLCQMENQLENKELDHESGNISIEHILPENPGVEWEEIKGYNIERYIYRLGNYTLMELKKNRDAGNNSYQAKRGIYESSSYKITSELAGFFSEWNLDAIERNQKSMAQIAKNIWKIN